MMINSSFSLSWPFQLPGVSKDYFYRDGHLFGTKYWEIQLSKMDTKLLGYNFEFAPIGQDHGGLRIEFYFLFRMFSFNIYDNRHWNYAENRWYKDGENIWD